MGGKVFQTEGLNIVNCTRIQNPDAFRIYLETKHAIKSFGPLNQKSISAVDGLGRDADMLIDKDFNECYMWYYAPHVEEILKGGPLRPTVP